MAEIIVELEEVNAQGHNLICRECRGTFKSTRSKLNKPFKIDNLRAHLIRWHKKDSKREIERLPDSFFGKRVTYIAFRKNLLRSVVYNCHRN